MPDRVIRKASAVSATNPSALIEDVDAPLPMEEHMEDQIDFLEKGEHKLHTVFPWERVEDFEDIDGDVFLTVSEVGC